MKNTKKWLSLLFTLLLFMSCSSPVCAAEENGEEEKEELLAPYFILQDGDTSLDLFPLKSTEVTTNINGIIAETCVVQTYANEGDTPINARYVFPTSSGTTVHGMKMEIGNQVVTAQIKEKEEAKEEYEEAKSEGKSASLMEQQRPNVFTMDVANIMPGDTARIELRYTQMLSVTDGVYEFLFPTVVGPRYAAAASEDTENASDRTPGSNVPPGDDNSEADKDSAESNISTEKKDSTESTTSTENRDSADAQEVPENNEEDSWVASPYLADGEVPPSEYHITVNLSAGVPIADISCKSHAIDIVRENDSQAAITLANAEDYAGNRDFILKYKLTGDEVHSGLMLTRSDTDSENYFMLTVQPPERFTAEDIPPREYIFVLDVSGSMSGYPLDTAKKLIRDLVSNLRESDKFNLVLFSNDTYLLSRRSLPASTENIASAINLIDRQEGGGGTSMLPALEKAIAIPMPRDIARSIVVITDGYISNEEDIYDAINENMDTASFFSFGIGCSVNDYLIKGIAQCGFGEYFVVTDSEDAEDCAARFRTYIESPLLTDISVDYGDFEVYDVATQTPSILYAQKPIVLFGKWRGEPSGTITVTGRAGEQEYTQEIPVADVKVDSENEAIRYLWARTRLDQLAGYGSMRNDVSVKEEITQLGLHYNMTTPYTSFVAVVDVVRNPEPENSKDVDQALPLPLEVSNLAVGGGYRAYSEPGETALLLILACVPAVYLLRRMRQRKNCAY